MKECWEIKNWKDVLEIRSGKNQTEIENPNGKYPILGSAGKIMGFTDNFICEAGTTIVGRKGNIDNPLYIESKFWNVDTAFGLHALDGLDKRFLFYFCRSFDFTQLDKGSGRPSLVKTDLLQIEIPIPPLPEQQRIVNLLDEAFEKIDTLKANAERNLQNAKELFESALTEELKPKEGWEEKTIKEIAKVIGGYSFKSPDFKSEGKYKVLRMGNVRPGQIRELESPVFINDIEEKVLERALLQINDVIITQTGTRYKRDYGFTVIIEKDNYLLNQRISAIRFSNKYLPKFFLYYSWTNFFKDQYFANETGTVGQGNVGINAINDAIIPLPSLTEQQTIVEHLDALSARCKALEINYQKTITQCDELKKAVLAKAFNGEL